MNNSDLDELKTKCALCRLNSGSANGLLWDSIKRRFRNSGYDLGIREGGKIIALIKRES